MQCVCKKEGIIKIYFVNVFVRNNPNDMCVLFATAAKLKRTTKIKREKNNDRPSTVYKKAGKMNFVCLCISCPRV